ncbi:MAG: cytochrome c biogenesis protein ResB [Planctomycetes bacterium]|nr:cytochrome c biogenesis protein ResB [Planctomycetota bacterium]
MLLRHRAIRFLGSLWFLLILLLSMLGILIAASFAGVDIAVGALRRDWYGGWWFNVLMGLLMLNLTVCTVIRKPWKYFWQWGFLITHSGILTLMIGAAVTFNSKIYGDLRAVEGNAYDAFTLENEREMIVQTSSGREAAFDVRYSPYRPSRRPALFSMPRSPVSVRAEEYLPNVSLEPTYVETPGGKEIVAEVRFHMEGESPQTVFLRDQSPISMGPLGVFFTATSDAVFANLSEPAGPKGTLVLTIDGETKELDVAENQGKSIRFGDVEVTVHEPVDQAHEVSVRFDVKRPDRETERYSALAFQPERSPLRLRGDGSHETDPNIKARLRVAFFHSAAFLCRTETGLKYIFCNRSGEKAAGALALGQRLQYPFMPLPFYIELVRVLEHAEEVATPVEPQKDRPWIPALRVSVFHGADQDAGWIKFGDQRVFQAGGEQVRVQFAPKRFEGLPFTLQLVKFRKPVNPGTNSPAKFESDVILTDRETGDTRRATIEVNTPFKHRGYVIYQSSYDPTNPRVSIFQISWDPGKRILYLGGLMAVSGTIFMFFLKPFLQKLIQSGGKAQDPPLASAASLAVLAVATLGTTAGSVFLMARPDINALWVGFAMAGLDLLAVLGLCATAGRLRPRRPGRALQIGHLLSAGWCLNTACLVILIFAKVQ